MTLENKDYEFNIIAKAMNSKLDLILRERSDKEKLALLKSNLEDIVYDIAKKIFQEVGIKVSFVDIRSCALSRSKELEEQIRLKEIQLIEEEKKEEQRLELTANTLGISKGQALI